MRTNPETVDYMQCLGANVMVGTWADGYEEVRFWESFPTSPVVADHDCRDLLRCI